MSTFKYSIKKLKLKTNDEETPGPLLRKKYGI